MDNMIKLGMKKSRDKLFSVVINSLNNLTEKFDALDTKVDAVHDSQLAINHKHLELLEEVKARVKNSGSLVLSETEVLTKIFSGLKMYLDPRDMAITPHLALDGIWEHRITAAWLSVVKPHDTVLDIGSNNGYYGALAAQLTDKKKSKVVLFEANPGLIPYIRKTLGVNWLNEQSVLEQMAIADDDGEVTLYVLKDYIGSSSVYSPEHIGKYMHDKMYLETQKEIKVPATSIDNYCKKNSIPEVDLIMMDIEGFEDKAYAGMRKTIQSSSSPTLFIEFTKESYEHPEAFYKQMLADFGHVYVMDDEGFITVPPNNDYSAVIGDSDDWVMPIFSKNPKLANH